MKTIFKVGDRVFHAVFGWGIIESHSSNSIWVWFEKYRSICMINEDIQLLSFTEYTLEGFSQERPEELPNVGQIVWVRNEFPSEWEVGYFLKKEGNTYYVSSSKNSQGWRSAGLEITTTNPYRYEQD